MSGYSKINNYHSGVKKKNFYITAFFAGLFFLSLIYEVSSDGVSTLLAWLPPIQWANFAGDAVVNVLQIIIFSLVAGAVGGNYVHRRSSRSEFNNDRSLPYRGRNSNYNNSDTYRMGATSRGWKK